MDHVHGMYNSSVPITLSSLINLAYGLRLWSISAAKWGEKTKLFRDGFSVVTGWTDGRHCCRDPQKIKVWRRREGN